MRTSWPAQKKMQTQVCTSCARATSRRVLAKQNANPMARLVLRRRWRAWSDSAGGLRFPRCWSALVSFGHKGQCYGLYGRSTISYHGLHRMGVGLHIGHQDGLA